MTERLATCVSCGCTDHDACLVPDLLDGGVQPCHWLRVDRERGIGVCCACPDFVAAFDNGAKIHRASIEGNAAPMASIY